MRRREPFKLKAFSMAHNFTMFSLSLYMSVECIRQVGCPGHIYSVQVIKAISHRTCKPCPIPHVRSPNADAHHLGMAACTRQHLRYLRRDKGTLRPQNRQRCRALPVACHGPGCGAEVRHGRCSHTATLGGAAPEAFSCGAIRTTAGGLRRPASATAAARWPRCYGSTTSPRCPLRQHEASSPPKARTLVSYTLCFNGP